MRTTLLTLFISVGLTGCLGESRLGSPEGGTGLPGVPGGKGATEGGEVFVPGCGAECDAPGESARMARLTHSQWDNTTRDLLKLPASMNLSSSFATDARAGNFDTHVDTLVVGSTLWLDYQRGAETLAATATASDADLARLLPAGLAASGTERIHGFIRHLGLRAFRRPLLDSEVTRYAALFARGTEFTGVTEPFRAGARILIQALLQSPYFLYRVEQSQTPGEDGLIPLTAYERATRLSFALWDTLPDDELFAAAGAGQLDTAEGVRQQAQRMLGDARAKATLTRFHSQLFELDHFNQVVRSPTQYPGITSGFGTSLRREADLFIDDVVNQRQEGLAQLLTRTNTFVNQELAGLYGLTGTYNAEFKAAELNPAERSGLLTRLGFMTYYGHNSDSDPIRRGVFVNLRLLCANLPPPPDNVTPLPPLTTGTTREIVNSHTGPGTCGGSCHGVLINPVGFAFENYDGVGRYRTEDNGQAVNASASYTLKNGETLSYSNALELSSKLAEAEQTHACYAQQWTEYLYGRGVLKTDNHLVTRLGVESKAGLSARELVLDLVSSRAFLNRAPEAL